MMGQSQQQTSRCTECGNEDSVLFSNRPLHKGTRETLLICRHCANEEQLTALGACHWCGAQHQPVITTKASKQICLSCVALCRELARQ